MYICSPPLFMEERRTCICPPFCGTANKQDPYLILWSVRSLYHTETEKSVAKATFAARYC